MRVGGRGKTANASSRARLYQGVKTLLEPYGVRYLDTIPREIIHEIFFYIRSQEKGKSLFVRFPQELLGC